MTEWLRRYGVVDKDAVAEKAMEQEKQKDRAWLLDMPYEAEIDLHGLTAEEATMRLDQFVGECYKRGIRKILIIHGKGNHSEDAPVLSGMVRSFIERDYRLGESGHPDKKDGGKGATWVILREKTVLG
jgi:DNA-nicking Smr family endonuclease